MMPTYVFPSHPQRSCRRQRVLSRPARSRNHASGSGILTELGLAALVLLAVLYAGGAL